MFSSIQEVLEKKISYQPNSWSPISGEMSVKDALLEIQSDKYRDKIFNLRELLKNSNHDGYSSFKKRLPAVIFCATFKDERKKSNLKVYNSLVVLDVDKLDQLQLSKVKECFKNDLYVFSYWESPSQLGIKGLVSFQYDFDLTREEVDHAHKCAFRKLATYFEQQYAIELDNSGCDTTRLCFVSHDPEVVIKSDIKHFQINEIDLLEDIGVKGQIGIVNNHLATGRNALYNPNNRNCPKNRYTIAAIIKFLHRKKVSITHSYEEWYRVGMAIANSFTYDIGLEYFQRISSADKEKYNEDNCKRFLLNCYESQNGSITISTIIHLANRKGYLTKRQKELGSEVVEEIPSQVSSSNTTAHLSEDLENVT